MLGRKRMVMKLNSEGKRVNLSQLHDSNQGCIKRKTRRGGGESRAEITRIMHHLALKLHHCVSGPVPGEEGRRGYVTACNMLEKHQIASLPSMGDSYHSKKFKLPDEGSPHQWDFMGLILPCLLSNQN